MTLRIHMSIHNDDLHKTTAKRNTIGGVVGLESNSLVNDIYLPFDSLIISEWQANAGTGTCNNPERINDGNTSNLTEFDVIGEYAQVLFDHPKFIREFRTSEVTIHNTDGIWKIQYLWDSNWIDLINFNTISGVSGTWRPWTTLNHVILTNGIRLIATTIDTGNNKNYIVELQIRG